MTIEHFDVIIVGAGLSGIGAARHLQAKCPGRSYAILEGRDAIGGTWDLFRYPGIRSDSDMYTLGYAFRPWRGAKAIADGPSILRYVRDTAREGDVDRHIRFGHRVVRASWSSQDARWTLEAERKDGGVASFTASFVFMCTGYYHYTQPYDPGFEGKETFKGEIVHPQFWREDLDYSSKRVVVIGSGATAVTLVPELAKDAGHVTMLQRSPTYIVSRPSEDAIANWLRRKLPAKIAYAITRWKNVALTMFFFKRARTRPEKVKAWIKQQIRQELGPDYDVETHFSPRYNPWDQRLCLVPDSDLFKAIRAGSASIVTDRIDRFVEEGLLLKSGKTLPADIIVTATGLQLQLMSDIALTVDGRRAELDKAMSYKGMMYSDVPNLASSFGYTNASWTLKCDLSCDYVCRILNHMRRTGTQIATPRFNDRHVEEVPWLDFTSGYVMRSIHLFPKQGSKAPWRLHQNYARDLLALKFGKVDDGFMEFTKARPAAAAEPLERTDTPALAG